MRALWMYEMSENIGLGMHLAGEYFFDILYLFCLCPFVIQSYIFEKKNFKNFLTEILPATMESNEELDQFLLEIAATDESDANQPQNLRDDDAFSKALASCASSSPSTTKPNSEKSLIRENGADSSDDEDMKNFLEQKYNEYGRDVQSKLKKQNEEKIDLMVTREVERSIITKAKPKTPAPQTHQFPKYNPKPVTAATKSENVGVYTDPIFGIRIIHPLISSTQIGERMIGRIPVPMSSLRKHLDHGDLKQDWAVAGVIVKKSAVLTSKKGAQYVIWKLSDLRGEIKTISLFLFKNAYKQMWKTAEGEYSLPELCLSVFDGFNHFLLF